MMEVWEGIKQGANAYLKRQFRSILVLVGFLALILYASAAFVGEPFSISLGRAAAFQKEYLFLLKAFGISDIDCSY